MLLMNSTVWAYKANVNGSVSLTLTLYGQIIWTKKNTLPSYAEFVEMQPSAKPACYWECQPHINIIWTNYID